ncbi:hypothetical protein [Chondrinema litorale]|uniref:hypothetical protein n=1 Tax=Chondrinema litorale TaxID=2994555 RepID=UPI002542FF63|nr:hypothetical protein [Chondrinema litorale]UZR96340.1 hypothetical protein OQ292_22025 [Chondrinema litorale]
MKQKRYFIYKFKANWLYATMLIATLLFFIYKGIIYAFIGSYTPLLIITSVISLFIFGLKKSNKALKRILGFWAVLIILWSITRLLFGFVNMFVKPIPEAHVSAQLGITGTLFSAIFLFFGIYLWRYKNRILLK